MHHVWLGEKDPPHVMRILRDIAIKQHPDWEHMLWDNAAVARIEPSLQVKNLLSSARNAGQASDLLRYELLWRFGGVYLDFDVEVLKNLDELLITEAFLGWEDDHTLGSAIMGAVPRSQLCSVLLDQVERRMLDNRDECQIKQTGPEFLTWAVRSSGQVQEASVRLLPPHFLYPIHWGERELIYSKRLDPRVRDIAYTIHYWFGTWRSSGDPNRVRSVWQ